MNRPRWFARSAIGSVAFVVILALFVIRTPGFSVVGLIGAQLVTAAGIGVAGLAHHFAHRLIARRPWGTYIYGIIIGEAYFAAILGALTIARLLGAPGLMKPGESDPFADWQHWRFIAASGGVAGLFWGFLSRNEVPMESDD